MKYVVMGNEAADLDSMASALIYSTYKKAQDKSFSAEYIPYVPIPREDFKLRTEATYLFREAGMSSDQLKFLNEVDLETLRKQGQLKLILLDHNKLSKAFSGYDDLVEEIIDHHQDEGLYPHVKVRKIEPVGSTCTLVAEEVFKNAESLLSEKISLLLFGTILLDTVNLDLKAGRVTPKDTHIAQKLSARVKIEGNTLFQTLQSEKFNVADLTSSDLLRKDYKEYTAGSFKYGMSTVLISLHAWAEKDPNLARELDQYRRKRALNLLILMIAYTEPKFQRELVLVGEKQAHIENLVEYLNSKKAELSSHSLMKGNTCLSQGTSWIGYYIQGNADYSRKKLQPLLQEKLEPIRL
ncbi:MAG: DHHA2 domain-containing protein [Spirochaetales bacterium]